MTDESDIFDFKDHTYKRDGEHAIKKAVVRLRYPTVNQEDRSVYQKHTQTIDRLEINDAGKHILYYTQNGNFFDWKVPNTDESMKFLNEVFDKILVQHVNKDTGSFKEDDVTTILFSPPVSVEVEIEKQARGKFEAEWQWISVTEQ